MRAFKWKCGIGVRTFAGKRLRKCTLLSEVDSETEVVNNYTLTSDSIKCFTKFLLFLLFNRLDNGYTLTRLSPPFRPFGPRYSSVVA